MGAPTRKINLRWLETNFPCRAACPVGTNAGGYASLISEGRYEEAYLLARRPNPLASVCGWICAHPCEAACRRGSLDDPISIGLVPESSAAEIMARADRLQLDFLRVLRAGFGVRSRIMDGMRRGNIERSPTLPLAVARLCSRELLSGERYMEGR